MRISVIALAVLVTTEVAASPVLAQSALVPHVHSRPGPSRPGLAAGTIGLVPRSHPGHHFKRDSGNRFGFGSGFVFGDAKGFGIGEDRNVRHDRWRGRHSGRHDDRDDDVIGYGYDDYYGSYVATAPSRDQFGYFGNGGEVEQVNGRAVYDYDRSYPYEYYRGPRREEAAADGASAGRSAPSGCETQWVPDGRGGGDVPVRICRR